MAKVQNFSVPGGDDVRLDFVIDPSDLDPGSTLLGATIRWWASTQRFGIPDIDDVLIEKISPATIAITGALAFSVTMSSADTKDLGNTRLYHQAQVQDQNGKLTTVTTGILTVQPTIIRP